MGKVSDVKRMFGAQMRLAQMPITFFKLHYVKGKTVPQYTINVSDLYIEAHGYFDFPAVMVAVDKLGCVLYFCNELFTQQEDWFQEACMEHEAGHVSLGHIANNRKSRIMVVLSNMLPKFIGYKWECAADDYAASKVSALDMARALELMQQYLSASGAKTPLITRRILRLI